MKLYLSGPMTGIDDFNYPLFHAVAEQLRSEGYEVYSPAEIDSGAQIAPTEEEAKPWRYYMTKALLMQLECDAWAGLPGWTKSRGAKREFDLAVDLEHKLYLIRPDREIIEDSNGYYWLQEIL